LRAQRKQVVSLSKGLGRIDLVACASQDFIDEKENVWFVLYQQNATHASTTLKARLRKVTSCLPPLCKDL
jgi:hypothetical protein